MVKQLAKPASDLPYSLKYGKEARKSNSSFTILFEV